MNVALPVIRFFLASEMQQSLWILRNQRQRGASRQSSRQNDSSQDVPAPPAEAAVLIESSNPCWADVRNSTGDVRRKALAIPVCSTIAPLPTVLVAHSIETRPSTTNAALEISAGRRAGRC